MAPKIRKSHLWLLDYLRIAAEVYPNFIDILRHITVRKPSRACVQGAAAVTTKHAKGVYTITLMTHDWDLLTQTYTREKKPELLDTLAHELAHVYTDYTDDSMKHTPKMYKMRNNLHTLFMDHLEKLGYTSEEDEKNDSRIPHKSPRI
jgi:hypothetical protein